MCKRVVCEQCQKPTFSGCGKHVEQALRGVAEADRCRCRELAQMAAGQVAASASNSGSMPLTHS